MALNYKKRLTFILQPEESHQIPFRSRMTHSDSLEDYGNDVTPSPWLVGGFILLIVVAETNVDYLIS